VLALTRFQHACRHVSHKSPVIGGPWVLCCAAFSLGVNPCLPACLQDAVLRGGKALPLYGRLLEAPHLPQAIVLQARGPSSSSSSSMSQPPQLRPGDSLWSVFLSAGAAGKQTRPLPHVVDAAAPSTILFSSGTTVRACCCILSSGSLQLLCTLGLCGTGSLNLHT
jgi:acyl-coenzyme A synthetase/AMP-(fatty) acid ligase